MKPLLVVILLLLTTGMAHAQGTNPGNPSLQQQLNQIHNQLNVIQQAITGLSTAPPDTRRLYYLTKVTSAASQATQACDTGFHFASLWEIFDTSNLKYDTNLGATSDDSGQGPPSLAAGSTGWIRTGGSSEGTSTTSGRANCLAWTTDSATSNGTIVALPDSWSFSSDRIEPWATTTSFCSFPHRVWCVAD
jgi:hypothetical protein